VADVHQPNQFPGFIISHQRPDCQQVLVLQCQAYSEALNNGAACSRLLLNTAGLHQAPKQLEHSAAAGTSDRSHGAHGNREDVAETTLCPHREAGQLSSAVRGPESKERGIRQLSESKAVCVWTGTGLVKPAMYAFSGLDDSTDTQACDAAAYTNATLSQLPFA
jgi:hypothetical protein